MLQLSADLQSVYTRRQRVRVPSILNEEKPMFRLDLVTPVQRR